MRDETTERSAIAENRNSFRDAPASGPALDTGAMKLLSGQARRLLVVASHVVQYSSPISQKLAQDPRLEILVAYCSMQGAEACVDPEFGVEVAWDTPLFEGYPWLHVPNPALPPGLGRFFGLFTPGLSVLIPSAQLDTPFISAYSY